MFVRLKSVEAREGVDGSACGGASDGGKTCSPSLPVRRTSGSSATSTVVAIAMTSQRFEVFCFSKVRSISTLKIPCDAP